MKIKYLGILMLGTLTTLVSCNGFLDQEPLDKVTPEKYFAAEADLAAYSINYYKFSSNEPGSYRMGIWGRDNHTDNQIAKVSSNRWDPGQWHVGDGENPWNFTQIRNCNYFFDKVLPKYEAGKIQGNQANIKHYIGEVYVLRAYAYFQMLQSIGDCPIITQALPDEESVLLQASHRQPRHKVARFILEDLDKAASLLLATPPGGSKTRISKSVAHLLRARVALYEGTFLRYHKGTAFVPGGKGWPGNPADVQGLNIDSEIQYFLGEAMKSAKVVGDAHVDKLAKNSDTPEGMSPALESLNPYYTMFCAENMDPYHEVLLWRQYNRDKKITHNIQMQLARNGGGTGWTRGLVNSFLMANGLPIYASASGYKAEWEKQGISATLQQRDSRIRIFTKGDNSVEVYQTDGAPIKYEVDWLLKGDAETRATTGFALKKGKHYSAAMQGTHHWGTSGSLVMRAAEALLIYMEATYELNHSLDATAENYWRALRTRAGVSPDFAATIAATNMAEEAKGDFGAYSHKQLIDATLYNIRRERRCELIGEGLRWADLQRWRACDQVKDYQVEGMRYWDTPYETQFATTCVVDEVGEKGNMSPRSLSVYVRPYQITKVNNRFYEGLRFTPAHYLAPLPQSVFRKTATNKSDLNSSVVYQNPGWGKIDGEGASEVE
ncbi:MAG: RagB/SusD family nutrient uptake outer membrane protein [Bacteroidales bacterium]|nr:RagB/SusD family nutrient uptake outer membrane protein [Bacteroidales bacterium]